MNATCSCLAQPLADAVMPAGFCAFALPVSIERARSVLSLPGGNDVLALERGTASVVVLEDTNNDGVPDSKRVVAQADSLNHGMAMYDGYLYASSDTTVYRWPWDSETNSVTGNSTIVINNINEDGNGGAPQGHKTRTLEFDSMGRFYVSVGSNDNVDADSYRSRIRRFDISNTAFPLDFMTGEVFADGIRNAVAMAFDRDGVLWAADTGADDLQRQDLGGFITNDNPAEELLRIPEEAVGTHYGYPFCWTEYRLDEPYGLGRGTPWAWPSFLDNGTVTDEDCRSVYAPADVAMQAHSTPLGITFYNYKPPEDLPDYCPGGAFPESMDGYVFIAFHGSWNRQVPTGYKLVYVAVDETGNPVGEPIDLLAHIPPNAKWSDGFRPVDVDFDECGRLLLSSDGAKQNDYAGAKVVRIESIAEQCEAPSSLPSSNSGDTATEPSAAPVSGSSIVPSNSPMTEEPSAAPDSSEAPKSSPTIEATSTGKRGRLSACIIVMLLVGLANFL